MGTLSALNPALSSSAISKIATIQKAKGIPRFLNTAHFASSVAKLLVTDAFCNKVTAKMPFAVPVSLMMSSLSSSHL
jgi:hypothetical protein